MSAPMVRGRLFHVLLTLAIFLTIAVGVPHHVATEHRHDGDHHHAPAAPTHEHHDGPDHTTGDHDVLATVKARTPAMDLRLAPLAAIIATAVPASAPVKATICIDRSDPSPPHLHDAASGPTSPRAPPTLRV
jgi:hypothetical protein